MVQIISIRALVESIIELEDEALKELGDVGARMSLCYAVQMLTPSRILAKSCGRTKIALSDVKEEVDMLFFDGKASAQLLAKSEGYMK